VKEVGKEDVEIDITIDSREKFIDFVHNTLIASKYIKDYVDASIDQA
jgi:mannitol/fructose-specific phosphotransferase system IIA component (Ntr-type)